MSSNVNSIDALRDLHQAVLRLAEDGEDHVTQLRQLAHRFREHVQVHRRQYWQSQLQQAEQKMRAAQEALARAQITNNAADGTRNTEAEILVAKSKQRLRYCLDKLTKCKRMSAEVDRVVDRFVGQLGALMETSESGLPQSANRLSQWIEALDLYADQTTPPPADDG